MNAQTLDTRRLTFLPLRRNCSGLFAANTNNNYIAQHYLHHDFIFSLDLASSLSSKQISGASLHTVAFFELAPVQALPSFLGRARSKASTGLNILKCPFDSIVIHDLGLFRFSRSESHFKSIRRLGCLPPMAHNTILLSRQNSDPSSSTDPGGGGGAGGSGTQQLLSLIADPFSSEVTAS